MVKIKGLIVIKTLSFKDKLKGMIGIYSTELRKYGNEEVFILKTDKYNDTVRKRFIRRRTEKLYVSPESESNIKRLSNEGFDLVVKKDVIRKNIAEITKKCAISSGVEKGKIVVGVAVSEPADILVKLKSICDYTGEIQLFGKKSGKTLKSADSFYNKTGVSVILKESGNADGCDVLILDKSAENQFSTFSGYAVCIDGEGNLPMAKNINGIKLSIPYEIRDIPAQDVIIADLFEIPFKINGFLTEKQKSLDKNQ